MGEHARGDSQDEPESVPPHRAGDVSHLTTRWRRGCGKGESARSICWRCRQYSLLNNLSAPFERLPPRGRAPMGELLHARCRLFVHRRSREAGVSDTAGQPSPGAGSAAGRRCRVGRFVFFMFSQWSFALGSSRRICTPRMESSTTSCRSPTTTTGTFRSRSSCSARCSSRAAGPSETTRMAGARRRRPGLRYLAARILVAAFAVSLRRRGLAAVAAEKARSSPLCSSPSSHSRGRPIDAGARALTFTTRAVWHVALVGWGTTRTRTVSKRKTGRSSS